MTVAKLPSETIDQIIDHLHNDRAALAACSLAAPVFVTGARHHLFQEVVLECSSMCDFLRLLDVPWSTISPAVRRIIISEKRSLRGTTRNRKAGFYTPENPVRLRARLQGVNYVKFSDISLADISPPFWRLLNDLKGIKEVEAHQISFESPAEFFQYVGSLPTLESLSISKSWWENVPHDVSHIQPQGQFCIPLLDVGKHSQHALLDWFLSQNPVPPVHTFRINLDSGSATIPLIGEYIEAAGHAMQNLDIFIPSGIPDIQRLSKVDFSPCTNIRSIHIEGLRIGQQTQTRTLENFMRTLFSQLRSPSLDEVAITLTMDPASDALSFFGIPDNILLQSFNWGCLPEILNQSLGNKLQKLNVSIRDYPTYQHKESEEYLRKGPFRLFEGRGILNLEFPTPFAAT